MFLNLGILYVLISVCTGAGIGIVSITSPARLDFLSTGIRSLTVSLTVEDNGLAVPIDSNVVLDCELSVNATTTGYSRATFTSITIAPSPSPISYNLTYSPSHAGRTNMLRCFGISQGGTLQFNRSSSISQPISLNVRPVATVNFCNSVTEVTMAASATGSETEITLSLSDEVIDNAVNISCSLSSGTTWAINFHPLEIAVGKKTESLKFTVTSVGSSAVSVTCSGDSSPGTQYNPLTSAGRSSQFIEKKPFAQLIPTVGLGTDNKIQALLVLDSRSVDAPPKVTYVCSLETVNNTNEAQNIISNPPVCTVPVTTPSPTNTTTQSTVTPSLSHGWQIDNPKLDFTQLERYKELSMSYTLSLTNGLRELLLVTCCSNSPQYTDSRVAAMLVAVDIPPKVDVDINAIDPVESETETPVSNQGFSPLGEIPCDLTANACDADCCGDPDCSEADRAAFSRCIPGAFGGNKFSFRQDNEHSCYYSGRTVTPGWHLLMCVEDINSAYLGLFHQNVAAAATEQDLSSRFGTVGGYSFANTAASQPTTGGRGYMYGETLLTNVLTEQGTSLGLIGKVTLPQQSGTGYCLRTAPVRFLVETERSCSETVSHSTCTGTGIFSGRSYLLPSDLSPEPCPKPASVQRGDGNGTAPVHITYYCLTDTDMYTASRLSPTGSQTFSSGPATSTYQRCPWDNGFTMPPDAAFNNVTGQCSDAVLDVQYTVNWKDRAVESIDGRVYLGTVSENSVLTQRFASVFKHYKDTGAGARSGNPGYNISLPIIGRINNTSPPSSSTVQLWSSENLGGLCSDGKTSDTPFGFDYSSSCTVKLTLTDLLPCLQLRRTVLANLDQLITARQLARRPNSDANNADDWIQVIRCTLDLNETWSNSTNSTGTVCTPWSTAAPLRMPANLSDPISTTSICRHVPSTIQLYILYAETGEIEGKPTNEIVGGFLGYSYSDWIYSCTGDPNCGAGNETRDFLLSATVSFTKVDAAGVPSVRPKPHERLGYCGGNICYRNLFLPFLREKLGTPFEQRVAFGLVYALIIIGLTAASVPLMQRLYV